MNFTTIGKISTLGIASDQFFVELLLASNFIFEQVSHYPINSSVDLLDLIMWRIH